MKNHQTRLLGQKPVARQTIQFALQRPSDFEYHAGQHISLILPALSYPDKKGRRRTFTLASAPQEDALLIATRMTGSGFKETLAELPNGAPLEFVGAMGKFYLNYDDTHSVLIAGGIGITPFRSMLLDMAQKKPHHRVTLFYSVRDLSGAAYHDVFSLWNSSNPLTKFKYVMIETGNSVPADVPKKRIDLDLLHSRVSDFESATFYVCGPSAMVQSLTNELHQVGTSQARIRSESFWGY